MKYEIKGAPLPVVICTLENGEALLCESGAMSWMSSNVEMQTTSNGGIGKVFSRMMTRESLFQNVYTARNGQGMIAFASSFPGDIVPLEVGPGKEYICQKSAYLASTTGVEVSMFLNKSLGKGLFGGEGFIMQKLSGNGLAFVEIDGTAVKYTLEPGQSMVVSSGYLVMMSATCTLDIQTVKGAKNIFLGGEGLFNTKITGPGEIVLQTMPIIKTAAAIAPYVAAKNG